MKENDFKIIEENFEKVIKKCNDVYGPLIKKKYINKLTLKQVKTLKEYSMIAEKQQSAIFSEFRHIIGMIPLTISQTTRLVGLFKRYSKFRPYIHFGFGMDPKISEVKDMNELAHYKTSYLGKFHLYSDGTYITSIDDEDAESDCEELVDNEPNQSYKFAIHADGILVTCNRDNVFDFEQDLFEVFTGTKGTTLEDIIKKNVPTSFKYFGMSWTYDKDKQFKTNVGRNKQKKLYEFIISKYIEKK